MVSLDGCSPTERLILGSFAAFSWLSANNNMARCHASDGLVWGSSWVNSRTRSRLIHLPGGRHRLIRSVRVPVDSIAHTERNTSEPGERMVRLKADSATV